jgi:hypothetical protein
VLTKWQAEKIVCSYHWEVIDVACCDCVSKRGEPAIDLSLGISQSHISRSFYKAAPDGVEVGDVLPVTEDEWAQLATALAPESQQPAAQIAAGERAIGKTVRETTQDSANGLPSKPAPPSIAERIERMLRR